MLPGCEKAVENTCGVTVVSVPFLSRSHNQGLDCVNCHVRGGSGVGCFTISGTAYAENAMEVNKNVFINLRTQPNGQGDIRYIISTDGKGNFFTTNSISWADSLFVEMRNTSGDAIYKSYPLRGTDGACNRCHNTTETRLTLP